MHRTRLVPPPRRRWRVRDAAEQLGRTVQQALDGLAGIGEYASGPRDWIEEPVFTRLAAHFGVSVPLPGGQPTPRSVEPDEPREGEADSEGGPRLGLTPPPAMPKRDNHPYREPEPRPVDLLNDTWVPHKPVKPVSEHHTGGQWQGSSAAFADREWALRGFTDAERDVWLAAGLREIQAKLAEQLRDAGLSPYELSADVGGWTILQRVNDGEDVVALARLYQRRRGQEAG